MTRVLNAFVSSLFGWRNEGNGCGIRERIDCQEERDTFHSHESIFMIRKCKPILTCFVYAHSIGRTRGFISLISSPTLTGLIAKVKDEQACCWTMLKNETKEKEDMLQIGCSEAQSEDQ